MPADLRSVRSLDKLLAYLEHELDWPLQGLGLDDLTFDYAPEEVGLKPDEVARVKSIRQLRPLAGGQSWGIFFVEFEKKRLPVVVLRRILRHLVLKKRAASSAAERPAWLPHDLLFISATGAEAERELSFAHFVDQAGANLAELRVLGWDDDDTPLKLSDVEHILRTKLRWDAEIAANPGLWPARWREAFVLRHRHVIRTADALADALAAAAKRIRNRIAKILDMETGDGEMRTLQRAFQIGLIHDLDDAGFADMFAQTITYGLFSLACRRTLPGEGTAFAKDDLTHYFTSPFLREMLGIFLGIKSYKGKIDFDELGVSDLTDLLTGADTHMEAVLADFNNKSRGEDPVIHFYEHFLGAYNKQLKVQRGVFYTPQPVVSYIVRSVHELLQTEFGLAHGLADTSTWGEMLKKHPQLKLPPLTDEPGETRTISPDEMFVQILDPATGTATFPVEVIDVIHKHLAATWKSGGLAAMPKIPGAKAAGLTSFEAYWNAYVPAALLPRLHAYELMMAPYAIAHMKLGLKLAETGFLFKQEVQARIYLTNALEPKVTQLPQLGFEALALEAAAVNEIKWYRRFTVVVGNPPYSNFGQLNRTDFVLELLKEYKRGLNEKKLNLDDDFIKFVRYGQQLISQSGVGALGLITNNVFLDGITHRQMRRSLLESFGNTRILDLHGSARKLETNREGGEENVFEIQQGVTIGLFSRFVSPQHCLYHADMWGTRASKYEALNKSSSRSTTWTPIESLAPNFFFVPKTFQSGDNFLSYPGLKEIFITSGNAIKTERDRVSVHFTPDDAKTAVENFRSKDEAFLRRQYDLETDSRDWTIVNAKADVRENRSEKLFRRILYRPFDIRHTWYSGQTRGFIGTPAYLTMKHLIAGPNVAMACLRQTRRAETGTYLVGRGLIGKDIVSIFDIGTVFPLYLYEDALDFGIGATGPNQATQRRPNLSASFLNTLARALNLPQERQQSIPRGLTPEDIFHYAYAIVHCPGYRTRYAEFLKIDFPRLPLTGSLDLFRALAKLGGELVALHLLESPKLETPRTEWVGGRNPEVEKISWSADTVWIDKAQTLGFRGVPQAIWNFHIGGYQVCEKWLKDRKGRSLSKDDIAHYHKIVVALGETIRLMAEIDQVIDKHGGWPGAFNTTPLPADPAPAAAGPVSRPKPTRADLGLQTEDELPLG